MCAFSFCSFPVDKDLPAEGENVVILKCALIRLDYQREPLHKGASVISHGYLKVNTNSCHGDQLCIIAANTHCNALDVRMLDSFDCDFCC